jgi:hypothetical protein
MTTSIMSFTREVLTQAVTFCHCADYNPKTSIGNPFPHHPRHFAGMERI